SLGPSSEPLALDPPAAGKRPGVRPGAPVADRRAGRLESRRCDAVPSGRSRPSRRPEAVAGLRTQHSYREGTEGSLRNPATRGYGHAKDPSGGLRIVSLEGADRRNGELRLGAATGRHERPLGIPAEPED